MMDTINISKITSKIYLILILQIVIIKCCFLLLFLFVCLFVCVGFLGGFFWGGGVFGCHAFYNTVQTQTIISLSSLISV